MFKSICIGVCREYMKGSGTSIPDAKDVAYLLARFACNNHTICDDELRPKGRLSTASC